MEAFINILKDYSGIIGVLIAFVGVVVGIMSYRHSIENDKLNARRQRLQDEHEERERLEKIRRLIEKKQQELDEIEKYSVTEGVIGAFYPIGFPIIMYSKKKKKKRLEKEIEELERML